VLDGDDPGVPVGGVALDTEIASDVGAGSGCPPGDELADQEVGGESLADPAWVEPDSSRERNRRRSHVHDDPLASQADRPIAARLILSEQLE
jgi:hypothetical protein